MKNQLLYEFLKDNKNILYPLLEDKIESIILFLPESDIKEKCLDHIDVIVETSWNCLVEISSNPALEKSEEIVRDEIRKWLESHLHLEDKVFKKKITDCIIESLIEIVEILRFDNNIDRLKIISEKTGRLVAKKAAHEIIAALAKEIPDSEIKDELFSELCEFTDKSIDDISDVEAVQMLVKKQGVKYAAKTANKHIISAIDDVMAQFPDAEGKQEAEKLLKNIVDDMCMKLQQADSFEEAGNIISYAAKNHLKTEAAEMLKKESQKYVSQVTQKAFERLRDNRRGQGNSKYNKRLRDISNDISESLSNNLANNIDDVFSNRKSVSEAVKDFGVVSAKDLAVSQIEIHTSEYVQQGSKKIKNVLHISGKGSRKFNKHIDGAIDSFALCATNNIIANVTDVIAGDKDAGEAIYDTAKNTAVQAGRDIAVKQGEEIVKEALALIEKKAIAKISDEATKKVVSAGINKITNSNAVMQVAGAAVDIGRSFKRYLNGDIDKAQLLDEVVNKSVNACASYFGSSIGFALGGPLGAAAGSMIASVACDCLYTALNGILGESASKKRYEEIHAMCEESKRLLRLQREAFERATEALFARRRTTIKNSFKTMDKALLTNDIESYNMALANIAGEFGREAEIMTFGEFQDFMINSDEDFVL